MKTETFTYTSVNGGTSSQVNTHRIVCGSMDKTYSYTYDDNGNILEVYDGTSTTSYVYDSANQLVRENNSKYNYTKLWTYDNAGNITSEKEYYHTTEDEPNEYLLLDTDTYGYSTVPIVDEGELNPVWGDLLTSYDGEAINYESTESSGVFGNPYNGNGRTYTWEHGRQLSSLTQNGTEWSFEYDAGGMRTKRTSDAKTYEYTYNGSQLTQMRVDGVTYSFTYDANGTPLTLTKEGDVYYYITNLQGDVVALRDSSGSEVAAYTYDAWGECTGIIGDTIENENPLRYRGYVYDRQTGLYYLQSRYYDPEVGRFLNADGLTSTGQGLLGNNMFAYCLNNPVNRIDITGAWPSWNDIRNGFQKIIDWVDENIVQPVVKFVEDIKEDIDNYDTNNQSEDEVFSSNYFSNYKGVLVVKTPFDSSFSFGLIGLSSEQQNTDTLRHEYGHAVQLKEKGIGKYTTNVALPSITINILDRNGKLPYDYYSYPWEAEANELGESALSQRWKDPLPEGGYKSYWDLIPLFFGSGG